MSLARELAQFALASVEPTAAARDIMKLSVYDWVLCGMAGAQEPVSIILRNAKPEVDRGQPVFGSELQYAMADAVLINGATSHALDYDDTHFAHIGHPSVAVCPTAFGCASHGEEMLSAALIGAELSVRVGEWLGRAHYQIGFHQTATAGAFGATAAAGRLIGLNVAQLEAAFGLAATQAAGLKALFGTMGKPYHAGLAARTGYEAALLAKAGFDTRGEALDGQQGFGPTHHGEDNAMAFANLGAEWRMERISHKFHACCHGLHAMLEALSTCGVAADRIASVQVTTHPRWMSVCNIADPVTGLETKFSYRHTAAMALTGHDTAALDSYTDASAADPVLRALRQHVSVIADETLPETASRVLVTLQDGAQQTFSHDLDAPVTHERRTARLRDKGAALLGREGEATLWQIIHANRAPDMEALRDMISEPV